MWSDYIRSDLIREFEKEFNCKVVVDTYDTNESMYTKLLFGAEGYDIVFPSTYFLSLMIDRGFVDKLDMTLIPNAKNIDWNRLKLWGLEPSDYGLPYMISFSGLGYRADRTNKPTSWDIFADIRLRGRMTMLNDPRETIGAALRYLHYSVNTADPKEIGQASDILVEWKQNLAKFESEQYKNGIATAEFLVCHGYSSDMLQVSRELPEVQFSYPVEGSVASCDSLVIIKGSQNKRLAHAFINYLHKGRSAKLNMITTCAFCPNLEALDEMTVDERMEGLRFPSKEMIAPEVIRHVPKAQTLYLRTWDEVKSR